MRTVALATLLAASLAPVIASGQSRAEQVASAFTKQKHVVTEKHGVRKEKYKDVRSEPEVKRSVAEYAGSYVVADLGDVINLRIATDGTIQGDGRDSDQSARAFVLRDAKIEGAVLTATKVFPDGVQERFEGVFMTRTERSSPADPGITTFGLGVVLSRPREFDGNTYDKLFYELSDVIR